MLDEPVERNVQLVPPLMVLMTVPLKLPLTYPVDALLKKTEYNVFEVGEEICTHCGYKFKGEKARIKRIVIIFFMALSV